MNSADLKKWLSVLVTTFGGAVLAYAMAFAQAGQWPTTSAAWQSLALGAFLAGASAVLHLLQTPPTAGPVAAVKTAMKIAPPMALMLVGMCLGGMNTSCLTKQQVQQVGTVTPKVLSLIDVACIDAAVIAPLLDPNLPPATVRDIQFACKLTDVAGALIEQAIADFSAQPVVAPKMAMYKRNRQAQGKW